MNKIKKITTYRKDIIIADINSEELEEKEFLLEEKSYDLKKNLTEEIHYTSSGEIVSKSQYKYNDLGFLIEEILHEEETEVAERKTFERDEKGQILKAYKHFIDGSFDTINYEYNSLGKIESKTIIDSDGEIDHKKEYTYANNNLIKETEYDFDGNIVEEFSYRYDDNSNQIEIERFDGYDKSSVKNINEFDEKNLRKLTLGYNHKNQLVEKTEYKYDEKERPVEIIEETQYSKIINKIIYDNNDNAVEQSEINQNGDINYTVKRTYNDNNELILSEVLIDRHGEGMNQNYQIRNEITYHED